MSPARALVSEVLVNHDCFAAGTRYRVWNIGLNTNGYRRSGRVDITDCFTQDNRIMLCLVNSDFHVPAELL